MRTLVAVFRNTDWVIAGTAILLSLLGLLSIYSSSLGLGDFGNFQKQAIFLVVGLGIMFAVSSFNYRLLRNDPYFLLILWAGGILALLGLFFLAPEIRGVKGWYRVGGLSIDPIEYVKIILIILTAKYFAVRHIEMYRFRHILLSGVYFGIPIFLMFLQPDLGSASLLAVLWIVLLLVSGIKLRHLLLLIAIGAILFSFGWGVLLQDYQKDRIISFVEPELDPLGIGWSQAQSEIAIGNGGLFGQGIGQGSQTQYGFLSEPQTDFIFAALAEEFGLVGVVVLLVLFLVLLWRMFNIGINVESNFPKLFVAGFATLLILQFLVNVGMNIGILPIIGLSLPFVSYGGSSLLAMYAGLGIVLSIKRH